MDLQSVRSVSVYPRRRPKQLDYIFKSQSKPSSKFISQSKPFFLDVLSELCIQKLSMTRFIIVYYWKYCDDTLLTPPFCARYFVQQNKLNFQFILFLCVPNCKSKWEFGLFLYFCNFPQPIQRIQDLFKFFQIQNFSMNNQRKNVNKLPYDNTFRIINELKVLVG